MGFLTLDKIRSSKCISETCPGNDVGNVLILAPFCVPERVQFLMIAPTTGCSFWYLPRFPMLRPCPGPHLTPWINVFLHPSASETQSSPVLMVESRILVNVDWSTWIPLVFGLSFGAIAV